MELCWIMHDSATADEFLQVSEYFEDLTCAGEMAEEYINTTIDDYYCHTPYYQGFILATSCSKCSTIIIKS